MNTHESAAAPHVVIVGAGFGGLQAARALADAPVRVTVVDRANHHLFQPLLYQVATAELSPADISAPIRSVLRDQRNTQVLMEDITGVDVANRRVLMGDKSLAYDCLVLATGAGQSYFGHDEWARFAPGLKTTSDATWIRRKILLAFEEAEMEPDPEQRRALMTFVIVGGGPTGVEMAGALAELANKALIRDFRRIDPSSARIVLVEAMDRILASFPKDLARKAHCELQRLGVHVRTHSPVEQMDEHGVVIAGERLDARTVIWTGGVKASPAAQWIGAESDKAGRAIVGLDLTVPGHPDIFVIGDTASAKQDGQPLPGVAPVAMQQGHFVARVIEARVQGQTPPAAFHYFDKGYLATVGRAYAIGYIGKLKFSGLPAWFVWAGVHIAYLVGFRNRIIVMAQWAWAHLTFQRGARLIPEDTETRRIEAALTGS